MKCGFGNFQRKVATLYAIRKSAMLQGCRKTLYIHSCNLASLKSRDLLWQNPNEWRDDTSDHTQFIIIILQIILKAYEEYEKCVMFLEKNTPAKEIVRQAFGSSALKRGDVMRLCPTLSRASVENSLRQLVEDGYLLRNGDGRNTNYTRSQYSYFSYPIIQE